MRYSNVIVKEIVEGVLPNLGEFGSVTELMVTRLIFFHAQEKDLKISPSDLNEAAQIILSEVFNLSSTFVLKVGDMKKAINSLPDCMPIMVELNDRSGSVGELFEFKGWENKAFLPYAPVFYACVSENAEGRQAFVIGSSY